MRILSQTFFVTLGPIQYQPQERLPDIGVCFPIPNGYPQIPSPYDYYDKNNI